MEEAPGDITLDDMFKAALVAPVALGQGMSSGLANEAGAGLGALTGAVATKLDPRQDITREEILATLSPEVRAKATEVVRPKPEDLSSLLEEYYKVGKKGQSDITTAHPDIALALNLVGGIATMKIPGLSQLSTVKSLSLPGKMIEGAAKGALAGGVSGLTGEGETIKERLEDMGIGAGMGFGIGGAIPLVPAAIKGTYETGKGLAKSISKIPILARFPDVFKAGLDKADVISEADALKYGNIIYNSSKEMGREVADFTKDTIKNIASTIEEQTAKGVKVDVKQLIDGQLGSIDQSITDKMPVGEAKASYNTLKSFLNELRSEIKDRALPKEQISNIQEQIDSVTEQIASRTKEQTQNAKIQRVAAKAESFVDKELMAQSNEKIKNLELKKRELNNALRRSIDDDVKNQLKSTVIGLEDEIIAEKRIQMGKAGGIFKSGMEKGRNTTLDQGITIQDVDNLASQKSELESMLKNLQSYNPQEELITPTQLYSQEKTVRDLHKLTENKTFPAGKEQADIVTAIKKLMTDKVTDKVQKEQTTLHSIKNFAETLGLDNFDPEDIKQLNKLYSIVRAPAEDMASIPKVRTLDTAFDYLSQTPRGAEIVNKYRPEMTKNARYAELATMISKGTGVGGLTRSVPLALANILGKHTPEIAKTTARAIARGAGKASTYSNKVSDLVSEQLEKLAIEPNKDKRNAILFGLMQNPVYREMIGQHLPKGLEDESEQ
jgi:hypothetical protein